MKTHAFKISWETLDAYVQRPRCLIAETGRFAVDDRITFEGRDGPTGEDIRLQCHVVEVVPFGAPGKWDAVRWDIDAPVVLCDRRSPTV